MLRTAIKVNYDARLMLTNKLHGKKTSIRKYIQVALTEVAERLSAEGGDVLAAELAAMEWVRKEQCAGTQEYMLQVELEPSVSDTLAHYAIKHGAPGRTFRQSALVGYMLEN